MPDSTYSRFSQTLPRLKGLAILMVVTYHLWGYTRGYLNWAQILEQAQRQGVKGWLEAIANFACLLGEQGVHFFLIASGFGLAASWWRQNQAGKPFRAVTFWRRRVLRLLPLYWVAHGLAIALFFLNPAWIPFGSEIWTQGTGSIAFAIFASLTTLRNFLIQNYSFLNGAWWYVGLSIQLYLIFPVLIWIGRRWSWSVLLSGALGVSLIYRSLVVLSSGMLEPRIVEVLLKGAFFPSRLFEFVFGMILAVSLLESRPVFLLKSRWLPFTAGLWIFGLVCDGLASTGQLAFSIPADALIGVGELCVFYQLLSFKLPSLNFLGDYSYGIFLTHMNFYVPAWMITTRIIPNYWIRFVAVTLVTCGLGYLFEWSYRRLQRKGTA
ncbi:acyltransferase family protein [Leptolyngbya sp. NIES-2104]|uniref:acyltransferase family protein n=1 Tax=Leptolyngbya sp. NIES-2104 TaxID=1552121 RepID=UPI0006ECC1FF|nr:acyltransferase family protein [Leptolyngbya sp. NIES-2104]GAP97819.1 exopolysaccharide production protein ExoZ [Leptolyngbya sp. NIES-2104]